MFLKSITLRGFKGVRDTKKVSFECRKNFSSNSFDNSDFIDGFSFIFDAKYVSNENFKSLAHPHAKGVSYVEINCWRSKEDPATNYDWLCEKEITLKRTLQHPKNIYINKKRYDVSTFHTSLLQLGVESICNLHLHRLRDVDIRRLGSLSGEDFWGMLIRVVECEELIEIVERKEGILKKEGLKERYNALADVITMELPKKFQIRNEVKERIRINRQFFTLYYILTEQRQGVLEKYKEQCTKEVETSKRSIKESAYNHLVKRQKLQIALESMMSDRSYFAAVKAQVDKLSLQISKHERDEDKHLSIPGALALINSCVFNENVDEETASVKSSLAAWKINLMHAKRNGELEAEVDKMRPLLDFAADFGTLTDFTDEPSTGDFLKYASSEVTTTGKIAKLTNQIMESRKKLFSCRSNAHTIAIQGSFEHALPDTIFEVERVVQSNPAFAGDYIGPVFKFLDKKIKLDTVTWNHINDIANIFLFRKKAIASNFVEEFLQKAKKGVEDPLKVIPDHRFQLCCIEELTEAKEYDSDIHDSEVFLSLQNLILKETPSEVKKIIKTLFYEFLVVRTDEWDPEKALHNFKIINVTEGGASTVYHKKTVRVINDTREFYDKLGKGPVEVMHEMYEQILRQLKVASNIEILEKLQSDLKSAMRHEREEIVENYTGAVFNVNEKPKAPSEFSIIAETLINDPDLVAEIDEWNEESLKKQLKSSMLRDHSDIEIQEHTQGIKEDVAEYLVNFPLPFALDSNKGVCEILSKARQDLQDFLDNNEPAEIQLHQIERSTELVTSSCLQDSKEYFESISRYLRMRSNKSWMENMIKGLAATLEVAHNPETSGTFFHQEIYDQNQSSDCDAMIGEFFEAARKLNELNKKRIINLRRLKVAEYKKLIESIGHVSKYSQEDDFAPVQVKKRAYPLMNYVVVKFLKDTVSSLTSTYTHILADYITRSELFFFTSPENGVDSYNFSWNCLDLTLLKAIEMVEAWKSDEERNSLEAATRQRIKGLLLILHIINYISVFKFIILSETVFEDLTDSVVEKVREVLDAISPFVQIIIYKESQGGRIDRTEDEQMEDTHVVPESNQSHWPDQMEIDEDFEDDISVIS